ncbi:MAG: DUF726 domain-containing protein [Campylobacterota bacterium]|nr:DUF726 domain-containing protein [Campylobacterota bacterium]
MSKFKKISSFEYDEQKDIFTILVNLFFLDIKYKNEYEKYLDNLISFGDVKKEDCFNLFKQQDNIKKHYEMIVLNDISFQGKDYLNFILKDIYKTTKSKIMKKEIKHILSKTIKKDDKKAFIDKVKIKIAKTLAFSTNDGDYGIKLLSKGKTNTIHIFINGFTNDIQKDSFDGWIRHTKNILNQQDSFYGYHWACGKDPSKEVLKIPNISDLKNPSKYLSFIRGFNPYVILGILSVQTLSEWKNAYYNSKKCSEGLAKFIIEQYNNNPNTKFNIYGHSLGVNLIHHSLNQLGDSDIKIQNVFLFAGASANKDMLWAKSLNYINNLHNFYSHNDLVLKYLFQTIEMGDKPIGLDKIEPEDIGDNSNNSYIYNYNVSSIVDGHTKFISNLEKMLNRL